MGRICLFVLKQHLNDTIWNETQKQKAHYLHCYCSKCLLNIFHYFVVVFDYPLRDLLVYDHWNVQWSSMKFWHGFVSAVFQLIQNKSRPVTDKNNWHSSPIWFINNQLSNVQVIHKQAGKITTSVGAQLLNRQLIKSSTIIKVVNYQIFWFRLRAIGYQLLVISWAMYW